MYAYNLYAVPHAQPRIVTREKIMDLFPVRFLPLSLQAGGSDMRPSNHYLARILLHSDIPASTLTQRTTFIPQRASVVDRLK